MDKQQDNQKQEKKALQSEVADKYKLTGIEPGTYQFAGFGEIDLTKVDLAHADALVRAGFKYLKLKDKKADVPAVPAAKETPKP